MNGLRFLTRYRTPRPGLERACRSHRLGLGIPIGLRMTHQGAQCYYYRPRRGYHPARQFHALGQLGASLGAPRRAALVWGLYASADPYYLFQRKMEALITIEQICDGYRQCQCGTIAYQMDMWPSDTGYLCQECWERDCAAAWWKFLRPAPTPKIVGVWRTPPATGARIRFLSEFPAPQPRASYPRDLRGAPSGCLFYWRLRRGYHPARQFHALGRLGIGQGYHERAALISVVYPTPTPPEPCASCGQLTPKGLDEICPICRNYYGRHGLFELRWVETFSSPKPAHRAPIARPLWHPRRSFRLRSSRQRPHIIPEHPGLYSAWWRRPRTRFTYNRFHARYYATRRKLGVHARRMGFEQVRPGVWFDRATSVVYLQSAVDLVATENVVYALN